MHYITSTGAQAVGELDGIFVQVNKTLTGTLTLKVGTSTFAIITDPAAGSQFKYGGLRGKGIVTIDPSAACDVTVSQIIGIS